MAEYAFKHPLTQEVALSTQLRERRAAIHAAVAGAIEELHADKLDEHAALLAHHWEEAGEPLEAARWHRRAAQHISRGDVEAGRRHWQRVRDLAGQRESDVEAAALLGEACVGLLSLGFRLGLSPTEQDEIYASGKHWAERAGDPDTAIRIEAAAAAVLSTCGECERALQHALAAERLVERSGDRAAWTNVRWLAAYVFDRTGRLDLARQRYEEMIAVARVRGDLPAIFGGEEMLSLLLQMRGSLEAETGDLARADALLEEALYVARERGLVESEGWAFGTYGTLEWIDGDVDKALPRARRSMEIAEKTGSAFSRAWGLNSLAGVLAHAGHSDSLELAVRALALSRQRNTALEGEASHLCVLAEACIASGDAARACAVAAEAIGVAQSRKTRRWEVRATLVDARARLARGGARESAEIRAALDRTEELAREIGAPNHVPVALLERARLAELEGDRAARRTHLRHALREFERIGATFRVARIRALLAEKSQ